MNEHPHDNKPFNIYIIMINYSVFMMGNPVNIDAAPKAYAKPQISEIMPFGKFVKHIADHNGVFTRGTVKGVIADMCECLIEMLLEGKKVQLAELGNFWLSLTSEGAESLKQFTEGNINAVNIVFTPGEDFENLRSRATFNVVSSRIAQAATLKAEKYGESTVDLDAAKGRTSSDNAGENAAKL
jgi:predicted histone-like DNA-binding protein